LTYDIRDNIANTSIQSPPSSNAMLFSLSKRVTSSSASS
jgi:hypothetical protein